MQNISKRTIIYAGDFLLPNGNAQAIRALSIAKIFRELGYRAILVGIDKTLDFYQSSYSQIVCDGIEVWQVPFPTNHKQWLIKYITPIGIKQIARQYQHDLFAIICYNYPAIAQHRVKKIAQQYQAFNIADISEWYEWESINFIRDSLRYVDTTLRMRFVNHRVDAMITVSTYLAKYYQKNNFPIVILATLYDKLKASQNTTIIIDADKKRLVYAGNPFDIKSKKPIAKDRLDWVVFLLYQLKDENFILDIYGLTKSQYLTFCPQHKDILNSLDKKVIFHGRVNNNQVVSTISTADFTIFLKEPTRRVRAGMPGKYSESISYGTPVITNKIDNITPYAIEGKNTLFIDMNNITTQLNSMKKILSLSNKEVELMKLHCLKSQPFYYGNFTNATEIFLTNLQK